MLSRDRIPSSLTTAMPACSCRPPSPGTCLRELVDHHLDLGGPGKHGGQDGRWSSALAGGDCIDDADVLRATVGVLGSGQGAIHPGDLPAQLPVGAPNYRPPGPGPLGPDPATRP